MKIAHLLEAIEISKATPKAFPELYLRAFQSARFGNSLIGKTDDPYELGAGLLAQGDFFKARSGFLDTQRVYFPVDAILSRSSSPTEAIRDHLRWMLDCRRETDTIRLIVGVLNKPATVGTRASRLRHVRKLSLDLLANDLAKGRANEDERALVDALLSGELHRICCEISKLEGRPKGVPTQMIREMLVVWALFDLQIIAARLYHAERHALETGEAYEPQITTIASVGALMKEIATFADAFVAAFKAGKMSSELDEKLRAFIQHHDLERLALRNGRAMGLTEDEMQSGGISTKKLEKIARFLAFLSKIARILLAGFDASVQPEAKRYTRVELATIHASTLKLKYREEFHTPKAVKKQYEGNMRASMTRFSMPTLTALVYGIRRVTETIASIPADTSITSFRADAEHPAQLWTKRSQAEVRKQLLGIYRMLYTRDQRSSDGIEDLPKALSLPLASSGGFQPTELVENAIAKRDPKEAISSAKLLDQYRHAVPDEPETQSIAKAFESSLQWRFAQQLAA